MSCLFRSLSHFVDNLETEQLRHMICNYLQQDPMVMGEKFSVLLQTMNPTNTSPPNPNNNNHNNTPFSFSFSPRGSIDDCSTVDQYVAHMRLPSTWGGALEIHVFCELFRARVLVHHHHRHRPPNGYQWGQGGQGGQGGPGEPKPIEFLPSERLLQQQRTSLYLPTGTTTPLSTPLSTPLVTPIPSPPPIVTISLDYTGNHFEPRKNEIPP